jgi:hypothetical protein
MRIFRNKIKIQNIEIGSIWIEKSSKECGNYICLHGQEHRIVFHAYCMELFEPVYVHLQLKLWG